MELIYGNTYGACYKVFNAPNPICKLQLIVESVGIFMSEADLDQLLEIVRDSDRPCFCEECNGKQCGRIWCSGSFTDVCLKVDENNLNKLEDLILGTQFMMNMDNTLEQYRIK